MGFIDKIKGALGGASDKASGPTERAGVGDGVDEGSQAAGGARQTVGGVVEGAVAKVRGAAGTIDGEDDDETAGADRAATAPEEEPPEPPAE